MCMDSFIITLCVLNCQESSSSKMQDTKQKASPFLKILFLGGGGLSSETVSPYFYPESGTHQSDKSALDNIYPFKFRCQSTLLQCFSCLNLEALSALKETTNLRFAHFRGIAEPLIYFLGEQWSRSPLCIFSFLLLRQDNFFSLKRFWL